MDINEKLITIDFKEIYSKLMILKAFGFFQTLFLIALICARLIR